MIKSVITIPFIWGKERVKDFDHKEEMLIPKVIGIPKAGYVAIRRLDRRLPIGHRCRGDVEI